MPQLTILYWRDIPAQVIVGKGRRAAKAPLPERFEQAIDRAAMASGAAGTDDYLAEWRKGDPREVDGDPQQVADDAIARLAADYDQDRLKTLIANGGHAPA
ncbi:virulence factor [Ferrimonas balearica]|nr:virulence factor [Ferrimonas balearica]